MATTLPLHVTVVLVAVVFAAITDVWKFKVHNIVTLPLFVGGVAYHCITGGVPGMWASTGGAAFGFAILIIPYILGGMGAGDVKLMTAIGAWLGLPLTLYVFLAASIAAGLYALVVIFLFRSFEETWANLRIAWLRVVAIGKHLNAEDRIETEVNRADRRGRIIPFAAMIALGLIGTLVLARFTNAQ